MGVLWASPRRPPGVQSAPARGGGRMGPRRPRIHALVVGLVLVQGLLVLRWSGGSGGSGGSGPPDPTHPSLLPLGSTANMGFRVSGGQRARSGGSGGNRSENRSLVLSEEKRLEHTPSLDTTPGKGGLKRTVTGKAEVDLVRMTGWSEHDVTGGMGNGKNSMSLKSRQHSLVTSGVWGDISVSTEHAKSKRRLSTVGKIVSITLPENAERSTRNIFRKEKKTSKVDENASVHKNTTHHYQKPSAYNKDTTNYQKIPVREYRPTTKSNATKVVAGENTSNPYRKAPARVDRTKWYVATMSRRQRAVLRELVEVFAGRASRHNVTFFMAGGTLLGSYRHHGLVPWDDDVDLYLPRSQRSLLWTAFSGLRPQYSLVRAGVRWKFFSNESTPTRAHPWSYPFIDVCFYEQNDRQLWDVDGGFPARYDLSDVFPLAQRPFWNLTLPAPKDTEGFLRRGGYDLEKCNTNIYNHRAQRPVGGGDRVSVPCGALKGLHPFVSRTNTSSGTSVNETLYLGDRLVSWTLVNVSSTVQK